MKRYDKYKDSGISWIGEIPEHWKIKRGAILFSEVKEKNSMLCFKKAMKFNYGYLVGKNEFGDLNELADTYQNYTILNKDDIVINCLNLNYDFVSQRVAISPKTGIITSAYLSIRPRSNTNPQYYNFLLKTMDAMKLFHGMGTGIRLTLSFKEFKKQLLPIPSLFEQQVIVDYVDEKCKNIDSYIDTKQKELVALDALKLSIVSQVVTKGLDKNVPMKDSGISWIREVPKHWEIKRLKIYAYEYFKSNENIHHQNLLSLSYGKIIRKDINKTEGLLPASFDKYQVVNHGNIILRLTDLQNDHKSLRVGLVTEEGIITSAYLCLKVREGNFPDFFYYLLHTYDINKIFYGMGGGLRQSLNYEGMKNMLIPIPPLSEQQAIVDYINKKIEAIDKMKSSIESQINALKEYKQRLISDVVTGKIKVTE